MKFPYIGQMVLLNDDGTETPAVVTRIFDTAGASGVGLHALPAGNASHPVAGPIRRQGVAKPGDRFWTPTAPDAEEEKRFNESVRRFEQKVGLDKPDEVKTA